MSNDLSIFAPSFVIGYEDKKGNMHNISAEGALFKGGAALVALKDEAMDCALMKAHNGKYRAASDILSVAFGKQAKAFENLFSAVPWANKNTFNSFLTALAGVAVPDKGWSKKQVEARALLGAILDIPSFRKDAETVAQDVARTVEA